MLMNGSVHLTESMTFNVITILVFVVIDVFLVGCALYLFCLFMVVVYYTSTILPNLHANLLHASE